jgi:hypothetical protein
MAAGGAGDGAGGSGQAAAAHGQDAHPRDRRSGSWRAVILQASVGHAWRARGGSHFDVNKLIARLDEARSGAAFKRVGWLAEALNLDAPEIVAAVHARRSKGLIRLDPAVKSRGRMSKRWGLWVNVTLAGSHLDDS